MFYGVRINYGIDNWQIFTRRDGAADVTLGGVWRLEAGAVRAGVASATPIVRVMRESDNSTLLPWKAADKVEDDTWEITLRIPEGGLYRVETCLDTVSAKTGEHWMFRGDIRTHIGVGDVFIIAGQSNAAGYGKGIAYDAPDMRVHVKRNSGRWDMATHPLNDSTDAYDCPNAPMSILGVSPFLSFGKRHADATGCPVALIPTAQGGTPLKAWDPKQGGHLFRNMIEKAKRIGGGTAILWYQGCTDAISGAVESYADGFENIVKTTRRILGFEIPFYTFQINGYLAEGFDENWGAIKEAQRQAARRLPGVYVLPTAGKDMSDDIHNGALANVRLGEELADLVNRNVTAPDLETAEYASDQLVLTFSGVRGKLFMRNQERYNHGFRVEDEEGTLEILRVTTEKNTVCLKTARSIHGKAFVSYEFESVPAPYPIYDDETFLCVIPFYRVEIAPE